MCARELTSCWSVARIAARAAFLTSVTQIILFNTPLPQMLRNSLPKRCTPSIGHGVPPSLVSASHDITRLPKLNIPMFSGDTLQWQSFRDCFEAAVHRNPSITRVQKSNYLRVQLLHSGSLLVSR